MNIRTTIYKTALIYLVLFISPLISKAQSQYDGYIIGADKHQNKIYIMDPDKTNLNNGVVWSLSPEELTGVAPGEVPYVGGAEVKRVMGGTHILIVANGIALIRIADKRVIWHGRAGGGDPHSAELLPDGNIAVAASTGPHIKFFDTTMPNNSLPVNEYRFKNVHGLVWDAKREVLWATGSDQLHSLRYNFDRHNPNIDSVVQENFIEPNGHDLSPVPGEDKLLYTGKDMWEFDIASRTSTKIGDKGAKSMTQKEKDGEIIYTVGAGAGNPYDISKFQTPIIRSLSGPDRTFTGAGFYKVRWFVPCPFSYPEYDGGNSQVEIDPVASITANSNINITEGDVVELVFGGTDTDGTIVSTEFYRNGNLRNRTSPFNWTAVEGVNVFEVVITDNDGNTDVASITLNVETASNVLPVATITANPNTNITEGDVVEITFGGTDTDGTIESTEIYRNSTLRNWSSPHQWVAVAGTHTFEVIVIDNEGGQDIQSITLNIEVRQDVVSQVTFLNLQDNQFIEDDSIEVQVSVDDADGVSSVQLVVDHGDNNIEYIDLVNNGSTYSVNLDLVSSGAKTIYVEVEDLRGNIITSNSVNFTVDLDDVLTSTGVYKSDISWELYPNPCYNQVHIVGEISSWILIDSKGVFINEGTDKSIDVESLSSGFYLLKIDGEIKKFVKD